MTISRLRGLPHLLRHLTSFPAAHEVALTLRDTVFAAAGARTCSLWRMHGGDLVAVGQAGHTEEEADRYRVLPGALDLVIWRAVRSGRPVITNEDDDVGTTFATVDEQFWAQTLARHDTASVVRAPVVYAGESVGAIGMLLDRPWAHDEASRALLDAVCSVLGTWMSSPASGTQEAAQHVQARGGTLSLAFTDRQKQILRLVEEDATTPQIAMALRVSESSVKQDLQQAMRTLNTRSRDVAAARARELGLL